MNTDTKVAKPRAQIVAARISMPLDRDGLPHGAAWEAAQPAIFSADWQGRNADPQRQTEVRILWTSDFLFLRFRARFREVYVYPEGNTRRDQLWLRDVAEVFVQHETEKPGHYLEFEISPNGDWLDLAISPGQKTDLRCDLKRRVTLDARLKVWIAELAIPMRCFTKGFDAGEIWRLNLFRVEGAEPDRFYSAWQPTHTPQPNFHVPEAFGELHFSAG